MSVFVGLSLVVTGFLSGEELARPVCYFKLHTIASGTKPMNSTGKISCIPNMRSGKVVSGKRRISQLPSIFLFNNENAMRVQ